MARIDPDTGATLQESPEAVNPNEAAIVEVMPMRRVVVETFADFPRFGRFVLFDENTALACGRVKEVTSEVLKFKSGEDEKR